MTPEEERREQLKYQPAPNATSCDCMGVNGNCNADCSITCNAGYGDCDANLQNGCETQLNTISDCGQCGRECSCYGGAMCINGSCAGTPVPNGSPCSNPRGGVCAGSGSCMNLECTCSNTPPADMSAAPPDLAQPGTTSVTGSTTTGHGKSKGCDIGSGSLGGMFPLMVLALLVMFRRRSRHA